MAPASEDVVASSAEAGKPGQERHLVLDTGALIKGAGYRLAERAERFWTVPEVVAEVRDPRSR
jgi:rRNA maturation endonuclease Nob1